MLTAALANKAKIAAALNAIVLMANAFVFIILFINQWKIIYYYTLRNNCAN